MIALALVAKVLHQDLRYLKTMPLPELLVWAKIAAEMDGRKFS